MDAHLSGQIRTLTDSIHTLSDSLRVLLREMSCMPEILRQQVHMQQKQDQLATKQDLLHTTIVGKKYHTPLPIMSSPPPSLRFSMSSPQSYLQSPSVVQEIPTPQDQEINDIISYLSEYEEQSQSKHTQMPTSSSVMTVKWGGRAGSSTSMLGEDKPEPLQFADLVSSFLDKERSAGRGLPKNLTSSFPVAVQSGGPAPVHHLQA